MAGKNLDGYGASQFLVRSPEDRAHTAATQALEAELRNASSTDLVLRSDINDKIHWMENIKHGKQFEPKTYVATVCKSAQWLLFRNRSWRMMLGHPSFQGI